MGTIAPSGSTCPGTLPSRLGAAITTTSVVSRQSHRAQPTHTTVRMVSRTGRQDGLWPRRSGAAGYTERAAPTRARDALHPLEDVLSLLPDSCSRTASALAMHHLPAPLACRAHAVARLPGTAMQRSAPAFAPSSGADCRFCFQLAVRKLSLAWILSICEKVTAG